MAAESKCRLVVPWPRWALEEPIDGEKDHENWKNMERWVDHLLTDCLPSGGAQVFCWTDNDTLSTGGTGWAEASWSESITLTQQSTVQLTVHGQMLETGYGGAASNPAFGLYVNFFFTSGYQLPWIPRQTAFRGNASFVSVVSLNAGTSTAITLPAGTHGFTTIVGIEGDDLDADVNYSVTAVVGSDTGDTCMVNPV